MKKLLQVLCCIGVIVSTCTGAIALCGQSITKGVVVDAIVDSVDLENTLNEVLHLSPININDETSQLIMRMTTEIARDKEIKKELKSFVSTVLQDILMNENNGDPKKIDALIRKKAVHRSEDISALSGGIFPPEMVSAMLHSSLSGEVISIAYKDLLELVRTDMDEEETTMLAFAGALQSDSLVYGALFATLLLSAGIVLLASKKSQGFLALGIICFVGFLSTLFINVIGVVAVGGVLMEWGTRLSHTPSWLFISTGVYVIACIGSLLLSGHFSKKERIQ